MRIPPTTYSLCSLRWGSPAQFDEDKEIIDEVVLFFAPYSATSLTDLTMNQAPWVDAYNTGEKIISSESLIDYFGTSRTSEAV